MDALQVLCDEIFGAVNFVDTFVWKNTDNAPALSKKSRKNLEFIHCYEKQINSNEYTGRISANDDAPLLNSGNPISILNFPKGSIQFKIADGVYNAGLNDKVELLDNLNVIDGKNVKQYSIERNI